MGKLGDYLEGTTRTGLGCMLLASVGAFLFGFDNGWWGTILGADTFLRHYGSCKTTDGVETCNLSTGQLSAGSAVQSAGMMFACLLAVYVNDFLGRKRGLVLTAIISVIGIVIELTSAIGEKPRFSQFVVGKTIAAISMGLCANIVPIYLSETSTNKARGAGIALYQNILVVGVITAAGTVYGTAQLTTAASYLIPFALQLIAPGFMLATSPFLPESPRWLVTKGRLEEAKIAAERIFGTPTNDFNAVEYINAIELAVAEDKELNAASGGWIDLLRSPFLRRLLIAMGMQCLQQAQGSSYMSNYIVSFLQANGVKDVFPAIMGVNALYYVSILTGHILPDKFGRRPLIISTALFCGVVLLIVAVLTTTVNPPTAATSNASLALILIWQVGFGIQSTLVWITTAEAAPTRNRERVLAVAVFIGFGVSLMITSVSPYIQNEDYGNLGGRIGFIWSSFSFFTVIWVFFFLPEMKGFSLEQLDFLFANKTPTRKFKSYKFGHSVLATEELKNGSQEAVQEEIIETAGKLK
ncbi:unnamed protein product [Clonostachys byssicola]|uniref:Major facilitator superfamily (MFS) profile domain-containing protein n=1 Tax=Clonostachys byssicola TaxID=160290 RepID=A0A9N9U3B3_9HYPO|nr:unnamed protein product [Clonostachys byssicola]